MLERLLYKWLSRRFQEELRAVRTNLTKDQEIGMLSQLYQNEAFRLYANKRENAIIIAMANHKPSDDEHIKLQGRREEVRELYHTAKNAHSVQQRKLTSERENRKSKQASA